MFSVGIDIQEIGPFREKTPDNNKRFYQRLFTEEEIKYCASKADPAQHFAARFAAKEAAMKALGPKKITPAFMEITNNSDGKPEIILRKKAILPEGHKIEVSLSHSKTQAAAIVLVHPE